MLILYRVSACPYGIGKTSFPSHWGFFNSPAVSTLHHFLPSIPFRRVRMFDLPSVMRNFLTVD